MIVPIMFSWGEKNYFVHIHLLTNIFVSLKVITFWSTWYEVRTGKQNVHANKPYSGKWRQKMYIRACKFSDQQVSGLPSPSL